MQMPPIFWTQKQDIGPSGRTSASLTFDSARQRVILFGGDPGGSPVADTWAWENSLWTQVADTGPSPRRGASLVDETANGRVMLFGGGSGVDVLGDTWVCADGDWTQVADTGPAPRVHHGMAYDAVRQRVVLFGGQAAGLFGDTWEWDGMEWTQVQDVGPTARAGHALAFDALTSNVILFGGWDLNGPNGETWAWNGTAWTQIADTGPGPRSGSAMAGTEGAILLFGGVNNVDPGLDPADRIVFGDTWQLGGPTWTKVQDIGPSPRWGHGMVYRALAGRVMLFGGATTFASAEDPALAPGLRRDTWEVPVAAQTEQPPTGTVDVAVVSVQPNSVSNAGDVIDVFVQLTGPAPSDLTLIAGIFADLGGGFQPAQPPGFAVPDPITVSAGMDNVPFQIVRDSQPVPAGSYAIGVGVEGSGMMQAGFFTVN
jgi:hypothetical protein